MRARRTWNANATWLVKRALALPRNRPPTEAERAALFRAARNFARADTALEDALEAVVLRARARRTHAR